MEKKKKQNWLKTSTLPLFPFKKHSFIWKAKNATRFSILKVSISKNFMRLWLKIKYIKSLSESDGSKFRNGLSAAFTFSSISKKKKKKWAEISGSTRSFSFKLAWNSWYHCKNSLPLIIHGVQATFPRNCLIAV